MGKLLHGGSAAIVVAREELVRWLTQRGHEVPGGRVVLSQLRNFLTAAVCVALLAPLRRVVHLRRSP